jgi:hypothetical protein
MSTPDLLPERIDLISEVPARVQVLYQSSHDGYRLSPGGLQLAAYRRMIAGNLPGYEQPPPFKIVKISRADWVLLLSAAALKKGLGS